MLFAMRAFSSSKVVFGVVVLRRLEPRQPRAVARLIGDGLHLPRQMEHIRREPGLSSSAFGSIFFVSIQLFALSRIASRLLSPALNGTTDI